MSLLALAGHQAVNVPMNKAGFVSFERGPQKAIGTANLNGCTAVMLVSKKGAILAHISPLPYPTIDSDAATQHTHDLMVEFLAIFQRENAFRLAEGVKKSGIVCAIFEGTIALPEQMDLIKSILQENLEDNPKPRIVGYQVGIPGSRPAAAGTVFIDGRGQVPKVYIEDRDQMWF